MNRKAHINAITKRICERSAESRPLYLEKINQALARTPSRNTLSCANLAHGFAVCSMAEKKALANKQTLNLGIVSSYNDMLSAHHPFETFPSLIKQEAHKAGAVAQVAGGVPAMCDGITQGQPGMELSLFSRDIIALSTAIALSHSMFDTAVYLGVCDKIVPGLFLGAMSAGGHLPAVFIPAGPMTSGISNEEKTKIRQLFAEGRVTREKLLETESQSYHGSGTCTFYGTANSNQMFMEIMGLHIPGSSFINPATPLREALTRQSVRRALALTQAQEKMPIGHMIDERSFVNAIVGLHATGGSTNHTIHLIAMAACAGIRITWEDIADISEVVPLLTRIYPNGSADVNHFNAAGGIGFLIRELLDAGCLHEDVKTVQGCNLRGYTVEASLNQQGDIQYEPAPQKSRDETVLISAQNAFQETGGLKVLTGNMGQAIIKTAALKPSQYCVEAPALVFHSQEELENLFKLDALNQDFIAIIRFQGPKANGMPELHRLTTILGVLQNRGFRVALVTDGRMSGASGKIPAAIHLTPEALDGGTLAKLKNGDLIKIDANQGTIDVALSEEELASRPNQTIDITHNNQGTGRELFVGIRTMVSPSNLGATIFKFS